MTTWFFTTGKVVLILGLAAFLFFGIFGMSHSTMDMGLDGSITMSNCPFMSGQAVLCTMNPLEHIAAWQSMFTTTLQQHGTALFAVLLAALALTLTWARFLSPRPERDVQSAYAIAPRAKENLPPPPLQELFSNGILNPKLF